MRVHPTLSRVVTPSADLVMSSRCDPVPNWIWNLKSAPAPRESECGVVPRGPASATPAWGLGELGPSCKSQSKSLGPGSCMLLGLLRLLWGGPSASPAGSKESGRRRSRLEPHTVHNGCCLFWYYKRGWCVSEPDSRQHPDSSPPDSSPDSTGPVRLYLNACARGQDAGGAPPTPPRPNTRRTRFDPHASKDSSPPTRELVPGCSASAPANAAGAGSHCSSRTTG